jgi:hypothetical protein
MALLTKIIKTFGESTEKHDYPFGGFNFVYPKGTKRIVKKFFLFSEIIDKTKVKGSWIIEQTAKVESMVDTGGSPPIWYNKWTDTKIIEKYNSQVKGKEYIEKYLNPRLKPEFS